MEISPIYHNSRPEGELPAQETAAFDFLDCLLYTSDAADDASSV